VTSAIGDKAREAQAEKYEDAGLRSRSTGNLFECRGTAWGLTEPMAGALHFYSGTILSVEV
jgi:hypothetical protein